MSYQVRITETAKQDLREIAFYIAGHSMDNDIAKRFIMELRDQCNRPDGLSPGRSVSERPHSA